MSEKSRSSHLKSFESFIRRHGLMTRGQKVLLAVSGGMDSSVLLDLFLRIRQSWDLTLGIGHLNHGLRGKMADRDESFVHDLANQRGLPFHSEKADVQAFARKHKMSIEEAARKVRYQFLYALIDRFSYDRVAVGHNANDQAETILMNLVRGSGIRGMGGMRARRDCVIRPLLFMSRASVESYATERNVDFVEDASNRDKTFLRNRIRWDVIPLLEKAAGHRVISPICRTGNTCQEAEDYLKFMSREALDKTVIFRSQNEIILDIDKFLSYFKAIQKYVIFQIFEKEFTREEINSEKIRRILELVESGREGRIVELSRDGQVLKEKDRIVFIKRRPPIPQCTVQAGTCMEISGLDIEFRSKILKLKDQEIVFSLDKKVEYLDYDTISVPLQIRPIREGDKFVPLGMTQKKKVHHFLIDEKVPVYRRACIPLLTGGDDIVWVIGQRIDNRFRVTPKTVHILRVEIIHHSHHSCKRKEKLSNGREKRSHKRSQI